MGGMTFSMRETANPFDDVDEDTAQRGLWRDQKS
jgi:hypothetical protein